MLEILEKMERSKAKGAGKILLYQKHQQLCQVVETYNIEPSYPTLVYTSKRIGSALFVDRKVAGKKLANHHQLQSGLS